MIGLTSAEVQSRKERKLVNQIADNDGMPIWRIILKNVADLPNAVIFVSVIFLLVFNQYQDVLLISSIMLANAFLSIFQEVRARNQLKKLKIIRNELVVVVRNGQEIEIAPTEIVLDDVIRISSGKYLYVDGVLLEGESVLVDESIMTGESDYVRKKDGDELLSGSFVTSGIGYYKATKVGMDSLINKISKNAKLFVRHQSPLQENVNRIVKTLVYITFATLILLFVLNYFSIHLDNSSLVKAVIAVITALVPQGVILAVTISLTLGVVRMASKKILVQNISTVETIAGVNVLCMDKTGTLTENRLELIDYQSFIKGDNDRSLISIFCEYTLEKNKTIGAIAKQFKYKNGSKVKINSQLPFNSKIKQSGLDFTYEKKRYQLLLGSLDALTPKIKEEAVAKFKELDTKFAALGRRNLFFIYREIDVDDTTCKLDDQVQNYLPLAFFSMEDRLRTNAADIINSFRNQGVRPVIISGDSPHTLVSLIKMLDVKDLDRAITGKELAEITDEKAYIQAVKEHDIFARVSPEQKVEIIKAYQKIYKYVAMIGDGVNDALAIKQANLGISLGSGADATRSIADVILLNDKLQNLSAIMAEGRRILFNSLRGSQLLLVKNIYAVILLVGCLFLSEHFPFSIRGLFVLSFMIGNLPVILMLIDRPSNPPKLNFSFKLNTFIFSGGLIAGIIGLTIFTALLPNSELLVKQTALLATFVLIGMINYVYIVPGREKLGRIDIMNPKSWLIFILLAIFFLLMYNPILAGFFDLAALDSQSWLISLGGAAIYALLFPLLYNLLSSDSETK